MTDERETIDCHYCHKLVRLPHVCTDAKVCIAALASQQKPVVTTAAVPEGWKLVPIEPTMGMLDAARMHSSIWVREMHPMQPLNHDTWMKAALGRYAAMLAAAPEVTK